MSDIRDAIIHSITNRMDAAADAICESMRDSLIKKQHVDTGALLQSIRHEIGINGNTITAFIIADAKNPTNGAQYAEFIELGTGAAHGRPGGRAGFWRYQDRHGNWHTTDGMDADPFISPSVEQHMDDIRDIAQDITYDIEKYWKLKGGTA